MKTISNLDQLTEYGIKWLTGESCKYSMRGLCDLSQKGRLNVCEFLGIGAPDLPRNWNTTVGSDPAVASIMLTRTTLRELTRFLLHKEGFTHVYMGGMQVIGMSSEEYVKTAEQGMVWGSDWSVCRAAGEQTRNTHAMSGRTE